MNVSGIKIATSTLLVIAIASACSQYKPSPEPAADTPKAPEPVTITYVGKNGELSADDFKTYIEEPVKKKYPHITIERINEQEKGQGLADLIAAKQNIDIYAGYPLNLPTYMEYKLDYNIEDLIKLQKFDLSNIRPEL